MKLTTPLSLLLLTCFLAAATACDAEPRPPNGDAGTEAGSPDVPVTAVEVSQCTGPSCPRGECGGLSHGPCDAYAGFDLGDQSSLCGGNTGSGQFCLVTSGPGDAVVIDCSGPTMISVFCSLGCGYNYAPDDCGKCVSATRDECAIP